MNGVYHTIHRPSLGEAKEVDNAYSIAKNLLYSGQELQAVYYLRSEYKRIWDKWKGCVSESIEEYKS